MLDASVVLCTHNPRPNYLRRVLDALRHQTMSFDKWELLLIDNASEDPLQPTWDISWHPNSRHIFEGKLGVAFARQRGIAESSATVLIFVDDDNVLDSDYVMNAIRIGETWPELGVWGSGAISPEFEDQPADYLKDLLHYLALRNVKAIQFSNVATCEWAMPWGAGLCMRSNVAIAYAQHLNRSDIPIWGRRGKSLMSGEDVEISNVACGMGFGMAVFPELRLTHLIPKERTAERYLLGIYEGTVLSNYLIKYKWQGIMPRNTITILGLLDIATNLLVRRGLEGRMFLAQKRAARQALNLIKANQSKRSSKSLWG